MLELQTILLIISFAVDITSTYEIYTKDLISSDSQAWKKQKQTNKLRGLSPRANYTDRAAAAGRRI